MERARDVVLAVQRLAADAKLPTTAHAGDAGLDLCCVEDVSLKPFERALVRTGIALAVPEGHAGLIVPRSGRAIQTGLSLVNTPGLIDSGYRGEVKVALINHDPESRIDIAAGERIAQLVIVPFIGVSVDEVEELGDTERSTGGFGSSGR